MENLKIGQPLLCTDFYREYIVTVKKITPTGIISINEDSRKFNKNGRMRGYKGYHTAPRLSILTHEKMIEMHKKEIVKLLKKADFSKCSLNDLKTVINLYDVLKIPMKDIGK